jgi:glutaredoxin
MTNAPATNTVKMFSRPNCHLCDSVAEVIRSVRQRRPFEFTVVNIEDDPDLEARYGSLIPVVHINHTQVFNYRVSTAEFERELERLWNR